MKESPSVTLTSERARQSVPALGEKQLSHKISEEIIKHNLLRLKCVRRGKLMGTAGLSSPGENLQGVSTCFTDF